MFDFHGLSFVVFGEGQSQLIDLPSHRVDAFTAGDETESVSDTLISIDGGIPRDRGSFDSVPLSSVLHCSSFEGSIYCIIF